MAVAIDERMFGVDMRSVSREARIMLLIRVHIGTLRILVAHGVVIVVPIPLFILIAFKR